MQFATKLVMSLALASFAAGVPADFRCRVYVEPEPGVAKSMRNDMKTRVTSMCGEGRALVTRGLPEESAQPALTADPTTTITTSTDEEFGRLADYPYAAREHQPDCPLVTAASSSGDLMAVAKCRVRVRLDNARQHGSDQALDALAQDDTPETRVLQQRPPQPVPELEFHLDEPVQPTRTLGGLLRHLQGRPYRDLLQFLRVPVDSEGADRVEAFASFYRPIDVDEEAGSRPWSTLAVSREQGLAVCAMLAAGVVLLFVSILHDFLILYWPRGWFKRVRGPVCVEDDKEKEGMVAL